MELELAILGIIKALQIVSRSLKRVISRTLGLPRDIEDTKLKLEGLYHNLKAEDRVMHRYPRIASWAKQVCGELPHIEDIVDEYMYLIGEGGVVFNRQRRLSERLEDMKSTIERICEVPVDVLPYLQSGDVSPAWAPMASSSGSSNYRADEFGGAVAGEVEGLEEYAKSLGSWLTVEPAFVASGIANARSMAISIYGMPGVGKTTLASSVYNEQRIRRHFSCRAWVCVSETCHALAMLSSLARKLRQKRSEGYIGCNDAGELQVVDRADAIRTIRQLLGGKRYLIVFDDVWDINFWSEIRGMFSGYEEGCRIVLTTRSIDVARSMARDERVLELRPLAEKQALTLFCKKTFWRVPGHVCPSDLEYWARGIVRRCSGLPLALVVVGSVMSNRDLDPLTWENSYRDISKEFSGQDSCIKNAVMLSFHYMSYGLKKCFLYCSIFPEDYPMGRKLLLRLLLAEGFVESEHEAEGYLRDLIRSNMLKAVQWNEAGRMRACMLHDVVREVAAEISTEQNFSSALRTVEAMQQHHRSLPRRLSIQQERFHRIPHGRPSSLRSLLAFSCRDFSTDALSSLKLLRVLDLRGIPIRVVPDGVFRLYNLHYLSLRDTKVTYPEFPKEIANLQHLQTLDLWRTHVHGLPREITELEELRHLMICDAGPSPRVCDLPKDMNKLKKLQTLKNVATRDYDGLRELTQLKSLSINDVRNSDALCKAIRNMASLQRLRVKSHHLRCLNPPPNLQKLQLLGQLASFPTCLGSLANLTHLYLFDSKVKPTNYGSSPLSYVNSLSRLVFLCLDNAYDGEELIFCKGHFKSLRMLFISEMLVLQRVRIYEGALPVLEKMHLQGCRNLNSVPEIENLPCLQSLVVQELPEKTQEGLRQICAYLPEVNLKSI